MSEPKAPRALLRLHQELDACTLCPKMIGPVVHGPPVNSRVMLIGQAPGPHEGKFGRPFAWTAGKTMFKWFNQSFGVTEERFRERVYMAAVARCFPGKAPAGGDRKPEPTEIQNCMSYLKRETAILEPELIIPVGTMAITEVLQYKGKLDAIVGTVRRAEYHGREVDVIALPHPSGASTWHRTEPGKTLLPKALRLLGKHPAMKEAIS